MRRIHDFHGGIHPPENKHQSVQRPIVDAGIPPELVIPLSQHIGAPATPTVGVGDNVLKGQMIAAPKGFVSVPVHASSSGTVVAIEDRQIAHPSGHRAPCIVIRTDGADNWVATEPCEDYSTLEKSELLQKIRCAGIAGMGGAGFPCTVKLSIKPDIAIETLIINGTECEPYITADDVLMRERASRIVSGAQILGHIIEPRQTLLGVEDNKPEAIAALREAARGTDVQVIEFPTKYPSGGEKQLIEILTGKQVPSGGLPADVGVVCQNVGTTAAVHDAIRHGRPLISRITTVTGEGVTAPQNFEVLIGTPMLYLLERAGYQPERNRRLIMGGPMMGFTVPDPEVPVIKTTNCLLAPSEEELPTPPPAQACIRCGMCAQACPASLLPQQMFWFAQGKEFDKLEQHNLFDCIECGACSYVCPSNIPLVQYYRASKAEILRLRREHEKSEQSRQRFEARQQRIEQEEREKEAKRAARKKAAEAKAKQSADHGEEDPVQAAIERAKAKKTAQQSGGQQTDELEKLEQAVVTTRKRLETATGKLQEAQATGSDLSAALQAGVDKTRAKLAAAEQALNDYQRDHGPAATPGETSPGETSPGEASPGEAKPDAAQAAIEKAMAARVAKASLSPQERARADLEKLQQRLQKTRQKLAQSRAAGDEDKIIEALESTVQRLEEKASAAERQLRALESA